MAESRGGRGNAVLIRFRIHRPAVEPSACGQIPRSFRQECPWSRYPGMRCYSLMSWPPAWEHIQRAPNVQRTYSAVSAVWTGPQIGKGAQSSRQVS